MHDAIIIALFLVQFVVVVGAAIWWELRLAGRANKPDDPRVE
jgi:hypothetical protein